MRLMIPYDIGKATATTDGPMAISTCAERMKP